MTSRLQPLVWEKHSGCSHKPTGFESFISTFKLKPLLGIDRGCFAFCDVKEGRVELADVPFEEIGAFCSELEVGVKSMMPAPRGAAIAHCTASPDGRLVERAGIKPLLRYL